MNMEVKVCNKCLIEKPLNELVKRANTVDGYRPLCKICYNQYKGKKRKNRNILEKEKDKEYYQNYRKLNYDKLIQTQRKYQEDNKEKEGIRKQKYREENREKVKESIKKWKELNKEVISESSKIYYQNNKDKRRIYEREKRKIDEVYRLTNSVRSRLNIYLKSIKIKKTNKTFDIVGCSPELLKEHLEKQFKGRMSWDNYGLYGWHIDHIKPLSSVKSEEEIYQLCHYTNLQPLWAKDNLRKGNKIINELITI